MKDALLLLLLLSGCMRAPTTAEKSAAYLEDGTSPKDHVSNEELAQLFTAVDGAVTGEDQETLLQLARHRDFLVRIRAVKALSRPSFVSDSQTQLVLIDRLSDAHWLVRSFAAKALGKSGRQDAIEPLRARARSERNGKVLGFIETALKQLEP